MAQCAMQIFTMFMLSDKNIFNFGSSDSITFFCNAIVHTRKSLLGRAHGLIWCLYNFVMTTYDWDNLVNFGVVQLLLWTIFIGAFFIIFIVFFFSTMAAGKSAIYPPRRSMSFKTYSGKGIHLTRRSTTIVMWFSSSSIGLTLAHFEFIKSIGVLDKEE